jgi:O-acetyl-ADP-ribose deacetylase (regulator of RNase III)
MASLQRDLNEGKLVKFRKNVHYESYARGHAMDEARLNHHYSHKLLYVAGSRIGVENGDLAAFSADAIVNSRSDEPASGLDEALRRAGGPAFRSACEAIGPLGVGIAAVTAAGMLQAKAVMHVRAPTWRDGKSGEPEALAACYQACLETADRNGYDHVAFPLLGAGGRRIPLSLAVSIGLGTVAQYLVYEFPRIRVTFVLAERSVFEAVRQHVP